MRILVRHVPEELQASSLKLQSLPNACYGVAFQEKAGHIELLPVQGGGEGTEERVLALCTEELLSS